MKLASALIERADIQVKLGELQKRLETNAKAQDGDKPNEDPEFLLEEYEREINRLEYLITKINLTNNNTEKDGTTLTALLAKRDCLKMKIRDFRSFALEANRVVDRYSRTEIKVYSTVKVADLQKKIDVLAKELRLLDETIQELNWTTDLME